MTHLAACASIDSSSSCQICAALVNDLQVISYLVHERGVWSLPSPQIKQDTRGSGSLCLFFLAFVTGATSAAFGVWITWLQAEEDAQCWFWLFCCFAQPLLPQLLPKVSEWVLEMLRWQQCFRWQLTEDNCFTLSLQNYWFVVVILKLGHFAQNLVACCWTVWAVLRFSVWIWERSEWMNRCRLGISIILIVRDHLLETVRRKKTQMITSLTVYFLSPWNI